MQIKVLQKIINYPFFALEQDHCTSKPQVDFLPVGYTPWHASKSGLVSSAVCVMVATFIVS
jgi:hypothetical protein